MSIPGVFQNRKVVLNYIATRKRLPSDPWDFRRQLARKLGKTTYYRALWLAPNEVSFILKYGMLAGGIRQDLGLFTNQRRIIRNYQDLYVKLFTDLNSSIEDQIRFSGETTFLLSVAKSPEIGIAVLKLIDEKPSVKKAYLAKGAKPYLFKVEIDNLDIIGRHEAEAIQRKERPGTYEFNLPSGKIISGPTDNDLESFVICCVTPDRITIENHPDLDLLK